MTPEQKSHVIKGLQILGRCVAMVGDDSNDLGALRQVCLFFDYQKHFC